MRSIELAHKLIRTYGFKSWAECIEYLAPYTEGCSVYMECSFADKKWKERYDLAELQHAFHMAIRIFNKNSVSHIKRDDITIDIKIEQGSNKCNSSLIINNKKIYGSCGSGFQTIENYLNEQMRDLIDALAQNVDVKILPEIVDVKPQK